MFVPVCLLFIYLVHTVKNDIKNKKFLCHKIVQCIEPFNSNHEMVQNYKVWRKVLQTPLIAIPGSVLCPVTT